MFCSVLLFYAGRELEESECMLTYSPDRLLHNVYKICLVPAVLHTEY